MGFVDSTQTGARKRKRPSRATGDQDVGPSRVHANVEGPRDIHDVQPTGDAGGDSGASKGSGRRLKESFSSE